ncbi:MAG: hypothetical protein IPH07_23755 [Deltaproteobacteria bacterium]|nr:hypothetical protein [Deltaproteobacteria bacterium]
MTNKTTTCGGTRRVPWPEAGLLQDCPGCADCGSVPRDAWTYAVRFAAPAGMHRLAFVQALQRENANNLERGRMLHEALQQQPGPWGSLADAARMVPPEPEPEPAETVTIEDLAPGEWFRVVPGGTLYMCLSVSEPGLYSAVDLNGVMVSWVPGTTVHLVEVDVFADDEDDEIDEETLAPEKLKTLDAYPGWAEMFID